MDKRIACVLFCGALGFLIACARPAPTPQLSVQNPNLDSETKALVAGADRVVFVIPFSHWDTDWHDTYDSYVKGSDEDIRAAIEMAKQSSRFRYTLEQVLFVQHFWETFPQYRDDLKHFIQNKQFTFAWSGITQPETSLVAPAIQERNLLLGQRWIADTFGKEYVPRTAWQSDAFGNSAALPLFLERFDIPYLFIGRWQARCDPNYEKCVTLPQAFYWKSPASDGRVLVTYLSYPTAWDAIHRLNDTSSQITALRGIVEKEFARSKGKFIFLPMGSDFQAPLPNLLNLVQSWNAQDHHTVLVMADPETAFRYLDTQNLPEITVDMNPIWQAFYDSRPDAKIADKQSEFYLTAGDAFGAQVNASSSSAWYTATINAHYDNIGAVSFDNVWENSQRPRFEQTVETAANDLARTLALITSQDNVRLLAFNPAAWSRSGIARVKTTLPMSLTTGLTVQTLDDKTTALWVDKLPAVGYAAPRPIDHVLPNPVQVEHDGAQLTLTNGLVQVTLDLSHGGTFTSLKRVEGEELLAGLGDDMVYWDDTGDIYGAFFKSERAKSSDAMAMPLVLAQGPLAARVQMTLSVGGVPLTKTVTLEANSPQVEVEWQLRALPETTALVETPNIIKTDTRTDDLGFIAFSHRVDTRPIAPGDRTYRREIFYPVISWSDIRAGANGLTLITHGLQGVAGTDHLSFMLVRDVTESEGLNDETYHTLSYAYRLHDGRASNDELSRAAYEFNHPLIIAWQPGDVINVSLPFQERVQSFPINRLNGK